MSFFLKYTLVIVTTLSTLAHAVERRNAVKGLHIRRNLGDENLFHGTAAANAIALRASLHDKNAQEDNLFLETDPICLPDENGVYGKADGGPITITYYFELEVAATTEIVQQAVLPAIENAVNDRILALFVDGCGGAAQLGTRRLELVGLASRPQDTIYEGLECIVPSETPCYVVEGKMSLFSTTASSEDTSEAIDGIKAGMEGDAFVSADARIKKLVYISDLSSYDQAIIPEEPPQEPTPSTGGGGGIGFLPIALSAVAGVALLVVGFLVMRRRSEQEDVSLMSDSEPVSFLDSMRSTGNRFPSIEEESETGTA